jgi:hypothetical protein
MTRHRIYFPATLNWLFILPAPFNSLNTILSPLRPNITAFLDLKICLSWAILSILSYKRLRRGPPSSFMSLAKLAWRVDNLMMMVLDSQSPLHILVFGPP